MHLAIIDITYGYAADRPDGKESLGGTTSAACFTARELVKAGMACTLFNRTREDRAVFGVRTRQLDDLALECVKPEYTGFVFCGRWSPDMVRLLRVNTKVPLIAWMHESSFDNKLVTALPEFDGVVYVSEWQKRINQIHAHPHWKQVVIRNGMNPVAANLFTAGESVLAARKKPPVLLYAGTAPRGVVHIPPILEELRKSRSDFTTEIYCNTNPSGHAGQDAQYIDWLQSLPSVTHVGMVGQTELAQRMKRATILLAPNPWPETSCIAMIEAMAAGLSIVTTNRAALPETAAGFAQHIAIEDADDPVRFTMPVPATEFARVVSEALDAYNQQIRKIEQKLQEQIRYCHEHYQWSQRIPLWMSFMSGFKKG